MKWLHEVSAEWLLARRRYLSATDVVKLWPQAKKWKPGDPIPATFVGMWFEKNSKADVNPVSYDAAARGHCMEPFAILDFNKQVEDVELHHWDDVCVHNGHLAFSPDALDIAQPVLPVDISFDDPRIATADTVGEVKCYYPYHHGQCIVRKPEEMEELMQIAMGFMVMPQLQTAELIHYCPGAPVSMDVVEYPREQLADLGYFDKIGKVVEVWAATCREMAKLHVEFEATYTEEDVYKIAMKEVAL